MKSPALKTAALLSIAALLGTSFTPLAASAAHADGTLAGPEPDALRSTTPTQDSEMLLAFDMNRIVTTQTQLIRYQATEYQRKVAEERARAFVAAQRRTIAKEAPSAPSKPGPKKPGNPETPEKPGKPKPSEPTVKAKAPELPRYIAVDTVKDKRASPKAKKVVMIWDTHAEALVGNNVYDVENPPAVGAKTTFDTYSAQYIGAGL